MPTEHIKYTDVLQEGTDKLNKAIDQANKAEADSTTAKQKSEQALVNSESTQTQLDTIVINGDSSVEAAQARVTKDGQSYSTLKQRLDAENESVTSQLAQKAEKFKQEMDIKQQQRKVRMSNIGKLEKVDLPSGFTWKDAPINIFFDGRSFKTYFDVAKFKNTGGVTYYIDFKNGLNTNDGLSEGGAFQYLNKALSLAQDGDTIVILDEMLSLTEMQTGSPVINKNINIVSKNKTIIRGGHNYTFSKTAGYTNVWEAVRTNVVRVVDYLKKYDFKQIFTSIADCDSTPGSWYTDGSKVYVHTLESSEPTNETHFVLINTGAFFTIDASTRNTSVYFEGIEFVGGAPTIETLNSTSTKPKVFLNGCKLLYNSHNGKGSLYTRGGEIYSQNVEVAYSKEDGFDYHDASKFIEVDCVCHSNGVWDSVQGYNGSTAHTDCKGVRFRGHYYNNIGPNIADVLGTIQTVNFEVTTFDSVRDVDFSFNIQISNGEMWLFNSESFGSIADLYCPTGGTMYVDKDTIYYTKGGAGDIVIESA